MGRLEPLKGVDTIVEALAIIRNQKPDFFDTLHLTIIGGLAGDRELAQIKTYSERIGVHRIVEFLGSRDQAILPTYCAAATGVIMPSDYESFGMVALEAMASGTPVIASEVGGLAFLVRHNEIGFLIPTRDSTALAARIIELSTAPGKRAQMSRKAFELVQQYSWTSIGDHLLPIFEELTRRTPISRFSPHRH